ncbi:MAG: glycosyltransferase [Rubripirellula sp.]
MKVKTGRLIAPGNLDAFCEAVASLLQNASIRGEFGKNGRQCVLESGYLEAMVHGYERLAIEICDLKAKSRGPGTKPAKPDASRKRRTDPFGSWGKGKRSSVL